MAEAKKPITPTSPAKQQAELRLQPEILERFRQSPELLKRFHLSPEILERFRPAPPTEMDHSRIDQANRAVTSAEIAELVKAAIAELAKAEEIAKAEVIAKTEVEAVREAEVLAEAVREAVAETVETQLAATREAEAEAEAETEALGVEQAVARKPKPKAKQTAAAEWIQKVCPEHQVDSIPESISTSAMKQKIIANKGPTFLRDTLNRAMGRRPEAK